MLASDLRMKTRAYQDGKHNAQKAKRRQTIGFAANFKEIGTRSDAGASPIV